MHNHHNQAEEKPLLIRGGVMGRWGNSLPQYCAVWIVIGSSLPVAFSWHADMWQFRERLTREFEARRANNKRYSLRGFAAFLKTDHSTLAQIFRGTRPIPTSQLRRWGGKLCMTQEEVALYVAAQCVPSERLIDRQEQLRHWTAEGLAIVTDPCHWQIVELTRKRGFRGDSRIIAEQVGVPVDRVNVAVARLLRLRLLEIRSCGRWKDLLGPGRRTIADFRKLALIRVRELAAKDGVATWRMGG